MIYSLSALSVFASPIVAPYTINTAHPLDETASTALNIGNLQEQGDTISVGDAGASQPLTSAASTPITLNQGDTVNLDLTSLRQLIVDQNYNTPDIQLTDGQNNVIADNQGTYEQQQAFIQLVTSGLSPGAGNYALTVTPQNATAGGTAATFSSNSLQGTRLNVNSQLTSGDPSEFYNFSFSNGSALKLAFDSQQSSAHIQLYNSTTGQLVADNQGNVLQQSNFDQLISANGLSAPNDNYQVVVSYPPGASTDQPVNYNFQLYSGNSYSVDYQTNATAQSSDNSAAASVSGSAQTAEYSRQAFHSVAETPAKGVNIGWIQENQSSLNVTSQLTSFDNTDDYNFTLQTGNNLKFAFANTTTVNTADLRIQLLNSTGSQVIADNHGSPDQQAAYAALTSSDGLTASAGQYAVKVSYLSPNVNTQNYNFQIYSGTSYSSQYSTIASAQTYENALLSGAIKGAYSGNNAVASYFTNLSNGAAPSILSGLSV